MTRHIADGAAVHPVPDRHGRSLYATTPSCTRCWRSTCRPICCRTCARTSSASARWPVAGSTSWRTPPTSNPPTLTLRTRTGIDDPQVHKHPAYVEMERLALSEFGLAAMSHRDETLGWKGRMPPLVKYVLTYLFVQAEFGLCCPVSMTDSLARTLKKFGSPDLVERFMPRFQSLDFDTLAQGAMFMTEQAAGSDIAATETRAWKDDRASGASAATNGSAPTPTPICDGAGARRRRAPGIKGVSLFLLPRRLEDGSANHYRILRLKDKLGTRSMASGEIRLEGALAYLVGEQGRGFVQMADMVNNSRLSNGVRAAGLMRRAVAEAEYIAHERRAFGKRLEDMPLMQRQLHKLRLPAEQARSMVFQTALALARSDAGEAAAYPLLRILTPLIKFRACRDARKVTGDAMEVRGGCGYIEEWSDPRLLRDAHLGSIWEGTSNIVALDVIRAVKREGSLPVLQAHFGALLDDAALAPAFAAALRDALARAAALAAAGDRDGGDRLARQAASALYHVVSAIAMAWEGAQGGSASAPRGRNWCCCTACCRATRWPRRDARATGRRRRRNAAVPA
jgi:acyl-CoA dehydrogenase